MSTRYDLAILGGGPGGYVAALRASQLGLSVALIDEGGIGGTCLQRGCIPTKALLASADVYHKAKNGEDFGVLVDNVRFDMQKAIERKRAVVTELVGGIEKVLKRRKVEVIRGRGKLTAKDTIEVNGLDEPILADKIIIATGSQPAEIPAFEVDGEVVITSDHALDLETLPKSMLIVGGGVIGCEFATFYSLVGVEVTVVEALDRVLLLADKVLAKQAAAGLKKRGVSIKTKTRIERLSEEGGRAVALLENGETIEAEKALVSVGRKACTSNIGLEEVGVEMERGIIKVDEQMRTNVENIFAIGDATGGYWLAHVASTQGIVAAEVAAGHEAKFESDVIPAVTFVKPELAQVGLTEEQCKSEGLNFRTGRFMLGANGKALAQGEGQGTVKLLVEDESDKVLGCHILGPHASDLIAEVALAMRNGVTADGICETIHAHPTLAEVIHEAAEAALGKPLHQV